MALAARRFAALRGEEAAAPSAAGADRPVVSAVKEPVSVTARWGGEPDAEGWRRFEVVLGIDDGWHLYAPSVEAFPQVEVTAPDAELRDVSYPPGKTGVIELDGKDLEVYSGRVSIRGEARVGGVPIGLEVGYQACEESRCLAPRVVRLEL